MITPFSDCAAISLSILLDLVKAIVATNFFLSVTLALLGLLAMVVAIWQWQNVSAAILMLWAMSALWLVRAVYQLIMPQSTAIPGLSLSMMAIFFFTALCFFIPFMVVDEGTMKNRIARRK
ncbi:MAG: hypothetical protein OEW08_10980 [Gammaproteobacteria bacterium]|nr:hypothetical protein [Gammaproteobacteria bacterium]